MTSTRPRTPRAQMKTLTTDTYRRLRWIRDVVNASNKRWIKDENGDHLFRPIPPGDRLENNPEALRVLWNETRAALDDLTVLEALLKSRLREVLTDRP